MLVVARARIKCPRVVDGASSSSSAFLSLSSIRSLIAIFYCTLRARNSASGALRNTSRASLEYLATVKAGLRERVRSLSLFLSLSLSIYLRASPSRADTILPV